MKKWTIRKILRTVWISAGVLFTAWLFYSFEAHGVKESLLQSNERVSVQEKDKFISFTGNTFSKQVLIFFPGAMVNPKAYVPLCRKLSENNINVYLFKMPWRQATKGYNIPKDLHLFDDSTKTYTLAGHSQGGKMAAQFTFENPDLVDRLIMIGTSHPRDISLSGIAIPMLKIYGSNDGVASEPEIMENKSKLPGSTEFLRIDGANHAQFGYYGFQLGDNSATISREAQQEETLKAMLDFLKPLER